MSPKLVPVIITWDVDPDHWTTSEKRHQALTTALNICEQYGIRSTFFITAECADEYRDFFDRMRESGQEVGCHGLTHTDEEEYDRMPVEQQRIYIEKATQRMTTLLGSQVKSFRSPRVKTSGSTLEILSNFGYCVDSSVCSQRLDFISSNLINPGWLTAPRLPYHPDRRNAFRRGDLPILELPVSAFILPLISGSLNVFGLRIMKGLVTLLYRESIRSGKPIVYLAHPSELLPKNRRVVKLKLRQFSPAFIRTHGLLLRNMLYRMNGEAWLQATHELFRHIASLPDVRFMTCSEYIGLR